MELKINIVHGLKIGEYEPGNGTRYTAVAVRWDVGARLMGALGVVSHGWLVASGNSGRAALFQDHGYLVDSYIQEHLGGCPGDYPYFGNLIRAMVGRPSGQGIDGDMPEDREAYYNERAEGFP